MFCGALKLLPSPCRHPALPCPALQRLASLGALLRGDRNAIGAGSELKDFDIVGREGRGAACLTQLQLTRVNSIMLPGQDDWHASSSWSSSDSCVALGR